MAPPRLLAVPIAGRETASSRLRLHALLDAAGARLQPTVVTPGDDGALAAAAQRDHDAVYVQKDARPAVVELCRRARAAGVPVVYDLDDDIGCWPGMDEPAMCALATVVTVDSPGRAHHLGSLGVGPVRVVPCMIDLAGDPARRLHRATGAPLTTLATFGNLSSLRHTVPYLAAVPPHLGVFAVGPADAGPHLPGTRLLPFRLDSFLRDLLTADVFLLAHGWSEGTRKDNNRLVLAMSLGVPTLTSMSPPYLATLRELGLEALACTPAGLPGRLRMLDHARARRRIGRLFRDHAWDRYSPERCAARFLQVLGEAMRGGCAP
jgi:hypothetical protein